MKNTRIKSVLKGLITFVLLGGFVILLKEDFLKAASLLKNYCSRPVLRVESEKVASKAMLTTINHYRPDLSQWKNFFTSRLVPEEKFLKESAQYYGAISAYIPRMAEAEHMLGLCHYFLGEKKAALIDEQKAVFLEPQLFAAWYDLGMMYYKQKAFAQSAESFRRALEVKPAASIKIVQSSRIYKEILRSADNPDMINAQKIKDDYRDAKYMFEQSVRCLEKKPPVADPDAMGFKIF